MFSPNAIRSTVADISAHWVPSPFPSEGPTKIFMLSAQTCVRKKGKTSPNFVSSTKDQTLKKSNKCQQFCVEVTYGILQYFKTKLRAHQWTHTSRDIRMCGVGATFAMRRCNMFPLGVTCSFLMKQGVLLLQSRYKTTSKIEVVTVEQMWDVRYTLLFIRYVLKETLVLCLPVWLFSSSDVTDVLYQEILHRYLDRLCRIGNYSRAPLLLLDRTFETVNTARIAWLLVFLQGTRHFRQVNGSNAWFSPVTSKVNHSVTCSHVYERVPACSASYPLLARCLFYSSCAEGVLRDTKAQRVYSTTCDGIHSRGVPALTKITLNPSNNHKHGFE